MINWMLQIAAAFLFVRYMIDGQTTNAFFAALAFGVFSIASDVGHMKWKVCEWIEKQGKPNQEVKSEK